MKKKLLATLLVSTMLASMFVGCGEKKDDQSDDKKGTESSVAKEDDKTGTEGETASNVVRDVTKDKKDVTISLFLYDGAAEPYNADWLVWDLIKDATGVSFDVTTAAGADFETQKQMVFASGDVPDIITHSFPTSDLMSAELLLPISDYEDMMPNFQKYIADNNLRELLDNTRAVDGKYYGLPVKARPGVVQDQMWLIREDIFAKHDIPVPKTADDILAAGKKLKELYPDSTPITNRFGAANIDRGFAALFGTTTGWNYGDGMLFDHKAKEWKFAPIQDNYKEYLTFANALYESGALDAEYATADDTKYEPKVINGETFIMFDWAGNISRYNPSGQEIDPNYSVVPIYPPKGPNGDAGLAWVPAWTQNYIFSADLAKDEEHLMDVLAYLDWGFTDEAETLLTFGDSTTYKEVDGVKVLTCKEEGKNPTAEYGLNCNELAIREPLDYVLSAFSPDQKALFEQVAKEGIVPKPNPTSPLNSDQLDTVGIYSATLGSYVAQQSAGFIDGSISLDEWDNFVAECKKQGADELQAAYDEATGK